MLIDDTLNVITISLWILFGVFVVVTFIYALRERGLDTAVRMLFTRVPILFLIVLGIITFINYSLIFIEPQEVGVVVSALNPEGISQQPLRAGLRWIVPFLERVHRYPIYLQTYTMSSHPYEGQKPVDDTIQARSSDGQEVMVDSSLIFRINSDKAVQVHIDWQDRYLDDFVRPTVRGVVRTVVSQYTAEEANSAQRVDMEFDINAQLSRLFEQQGFSLDHFILRNIAFSPEYASAIEAKQVAHQRILESRYLADAMRLRAQGESDALKLIAEAINKDKALLTYRYIDKLAPGIRVMLVPSNTPFLLNLPELGMSDAVTDTVTLTATNNITTTLPFTTTIP